MRILAVLSLFLSGCATTQYVYDCGISTKIQLKSGITI
jgi:hypothetical protein